MKRGAEISKKHIKIFSDILLDNDIQAPLSSDSAITDATTPPFSDKLMMFHMGFLSGIGIGNYATAITSSLRSDIILTYERLSLEIAKYVKEGANILIKNAWMEQPPTLKNKDSKTT